MKTVFVRKIFPYDPTFGDTFSKYKGYREITKQKMDPGIIDNVERHSTIAEVTYCSSLRRAVESAKKYNNVYHTTSDLKEVLFDLSDLITENDFVSYGSKLVRQRFIERFITNSLLESRESIFLRIESLQKLLTNTESKTILLVSHSFFMKILEAFFTTQCKIVDHPELIKNFILPDQKTYEFGKGFDFNF